MKTKELKQQLDNYIKYVRQIEDLAIKLAEENQKLKQDLKTSKANNEALIGQLIDSIEKNRIKTIPCKNCELDLLKESGTPKICKAYRCNMYAKLKTDIL